PPKARPAKKAAPPSDDEEYEVLQDVGDDEPDDEDVVEVSVAADEDEDDDEVEMGVGVPRIRAFVGNFEPGDRPLPKRKGVKGSGSALTVIGLVLAGLLLVAGGAAGVFFLWPDKDEGTTTIVDGGSPEDGGPANPVAPDRTTVTLPGPATDVCVGAGGRRMVVHCAAEKKLVLIDLPTRRVVREVDTTGPGTAVGAGATKVLLVDGPGKRIRRLDVATGEQDKEGASPFDEPVRAVAWGSSATGLALVVTDAPTGQRRLQFLDPDTLEAAPTLGPVAGLPLLDGDTRVRPAGNGGSWLTTRPDAEWGAGRLVREAGFTRFRDLGRMGPRAEAISEDGRWAIRDKLMNRTDGQDGFAEAPRPGTDFLAPAVSGPFAVEVRAGGTPTTANLAVRSFDGKQQFGVIEGTVRPARSGPLLVDQRVVLSWAGQAVAVLAEDGRSVEITRVDFVRETMREKAPVCLITTPPPATFRPGTTLEYRPQVLTNRGVAQFSLRSGPPGMAVRPDGLVTWPVPADFTGLGVSVTLEAKAADRTDRQQFILSNAVPPAPKAVTPKVPKKKTPEAKPKEPPKKSPDPMPPVVVDPIAPGAKLVNPLPARTPITAPTLADPFPVNLGGPVRDIAVGGGGRFLIAHVPTMRKLVIFDVSAVKVAGTIGLGSDSILFAAGMSKVLVVYPDDRQVLRYSLPDGKLELDAEIDVRPKPVAAAMGSATAGPLVLGGPVTQNNASKLALTFIDVETLKEVRVDKADGDLRVGFGSAANLRVSADGRTVATWYRQLQPSGIQLVKLAGNTLTGVHKAVAVGHVVPAPTGPQVFTEKGMYDAKGEPTGRREVSLPAVHGTDFLTIADAANGAKAVAVWRGGEQPAATFTTLPGFDGNKDPFERDNPTLALDKRLFLVPEANVLVVVPPAGDRFVLYPLTPAKK
ncbi:MAG TPA: hypothetical protein VM597_16090, partial [Gemmataceae bacterium]|nr:hypothetical protein [Gemmataceae bacterium]